MTTLPDVSLRLLTWNLHARPWPFASAETRLARVAQEVVRLGPDVALFQEVWTGTGAEAIDRILHPAGYVAVMPPERLAGRSIGGLLAFCRPPWALNGVAIFHEYTAHASPLRFWEGDGFANKGVLGMRLRHVSGAFTVVLNTHLQSQYGLEVHGRGSVTSARPHREARSRQLAELVGLVTSYDPDVPLLIAGDFNTFPTEFQADLRPRNWTELTSQIRAACWPCGTYLETEGGKPIQKGWLDYVFSRDTRLFSVTLKGPGKLIENTAVDVPFSDHHGICLDVKIEETSIVYGLARLGGCTSRRTLLLELIRLVLGQ